MQKITDAEIKSVIVRIICVDYFVMRRRNQKKEKTTLRQLQEILAAMKALDDERAEIFKLNIETDLITNLWKTK